MSRESSNDPVVYVVDDDNEVRTSIQQLARSQRHRVECFACAADFLDRCDPSLTGCILIDVKMPGMSGIQLQKQLVAMTFTCRL